MSNPVEVTTVMKSETEDSCSGSVPEVVVVETDNNQEEQETSVPQPMVTEEDPSEKQPSQQEADADFGGWLLRCLISCSGHKLHFCVKSQREFDAYFSLKYNKMTGFTSEIHYKKNISLSEL